MADEQIDWCARGFAHHPKRLVSDGDGVLLYRCWGNRSANVGSTEWGTGYFSLEKPSSVLEAELKFNIVEYDNGVHFVSTFLLKTGFEYWAGPVAHGDSDCSLPATQVYVAGPLEIKLKLVKSKEVLRHDVIVGPIDASA
jgi:hypothetical protein